MLAALRDFRIWMLISLGAVLSSAMWVVLGLYVASTLSQREQSLSRLTPDQRIEAELRMVNRLSEEVIGEKVGLEMEQLLEEQRLLMARLEAEGLEAEGQEMLDDMQQDIDALRREQARAQPSTAQPSTAQPSTAQLRNSMPPPGFVPEVKQDPISPAVAALGCGGAILMFGVLGTVLLFWPSREE